MDDAVDPREAARNRRRDRDASAEMRDLLRPGMGKVFKQIQDAQRRAADADRAAAHVERADPDASARVPRRRAANGAAADRRAANRAAPNPPALTRPAASRRRRTDRP